MKKLTLDTYFQKTIAGMVHPSMGIIPHVFITPSAIADLTLDRQNGGYGQQYDWDTYFIGLAWSKTRPQLMEKFRDAMLNFLSFITPDGHTPRVISPYRFYDPYEHHKPFLAQGILLACQTLNDYSWITNLEWKKLNRYMEFWQNRRGFHNLIRWRSSMESGVDNNATTVNMEELSVESVDATTYYYLELQAMENLAKKRKESIAHWVEQQKIIKSSINAICWDEEKNSYYDVFNFSDANAERIYVNSWTNFTPFYANLATQEQADKAFEKYILNPEEFYSEYGLRSLSKSEYLYNTAKRGVIYIHSEKRRWIVSNWQGPIWIVANWILIKGLENYGYQKKAREIKKKLIKLLEKDLKDTGTLHENYNPESGNGLWAPNFGSWNLLIWHWLN
jgi:putative isomerase